MEDHEFEGHLKNMMGSYVTTLCCLIGQRSGLVNVMMNNTTPVTSKYLAAKTNLKERYVREWLGNMTAAGIVDIRVEEGDTKYSLPQSHHTGMRMTSSYLPVIVHLADRVDAVVDCFKIDGPYEHGAKFLDLGSATGHIAICFARRNPNSTIIGIDNDKVMIEKSNRNAAEAGLTNVSFQLADIFNLQDELTESFDMILSYKFLHNLQNPPKALSEISRMLKPNGVLSMIEPATHSNHDDNKGKVEAPFYFGVSILECLPCSMARRNRTQDTVPDGEWKIWRNPSMNQGCRLSQNRNASYFQAYITYVPSLATWSKLCICISKFHESRKC